MRMTPRVLERPGRTWVRIGEATAPEARWPLGGPLAVLLVGIAAVQLACWLPQYLTWPSWNDHDVFATLARGWDRGLKPYRDLLANNFPGTIYLHWVAGRLFGWGRTWGFLAIDAALALAFCGALLAWSRRRFGGWLPGALGVAAFVTFLLGLDYTQAAQRDSQATRLALMAILAAECATTRRGAFGSGLLAAAGLAIRPQTVLFWPVVAIALRGDMSEDSERQSRVGWMGLIGLIAGLAAAFVPLMVSGIFPDFLQGIRQAAPGAAYFRVTPLSAAIEMVRQLAWRDALIAGSVLLLSSGVSPRTRRSAWVWLLALGMVLLYRPLSPSKHVYLDQPHQILTCVGLAVSVALLREHGMMAAAPRLVSVLAMIGVGCTLMPRFAQPAESLRVLGVLKPAHGGMAAPPGYQRNPEIAIAACYDWKDYRDALEYLRTRVGPETRVANVLWGCPGVTGPTDRLSAFPAESIAWLGVRPDHEALFAETLGKASDSVVIWAPSEFERGTDDKAKLELPAIEAVIRASYRKVESFGSIEIWSRATYEH